MKAWFERVRHHAPGIGFVLVLAGIYGPALSQHWKLGHDPYFFNDDARIQIFPFFRYSNPAAFANDYLGDYALALLPSGFRALYWLAAHTVDAEALSRFLAYPLLLLTVGAAAWAAHRIAGYPAAFMAACLLLGSDLVLERVTGGLPRSFGYPLASAALLALVLGRWRWLALLTALGAAFYPTLGVFGGLLLTLWFLVAHPPDRGDAAWLPIRPRLAILAAVAAICAVLLLPPILGSQRFGPRITAELLTTYPEAGPGGLASAEDRPPFSAALPTVSGFMERAVAGSGDAWWPWLRSKLPGTTMIVVDLLLLVGFFGTFVLARRHAGVRRMALFPIAAIAGHLLARGFAPYMYSPSRFLLYAIPPFFAVVSGVGLVGLVERFSPDRFGPRARTLLASGLILVTLLLVAGRGRHTAGVTFGLVEEQREITRFVETLPPDVLIAGWPDDPLSNIPLVARRRALITGEMHMPFHVAYVDEMRRRMSALIAAYFGRAREPLITLRDELGVTHLVVNLDHLRGRPPAYAPPYGQWITAAATTDRDKPYFVVEHVDELAVFRRGRFAILDLSKL